VSKGTTTMAVRQNLRKIERPRHLLSEHRGDGQGLIESESRTYGPSADSIQ